MNPYHFQYYPLLVSPVFFLLFGAIIFLVVLVQVRILRYAYTRIGIGRKYLYLLVKNRLYAKGAMGIAVVTAIDHLVANPVPGLGIAVTMFVPPVAAAIVALALSREHAVPLAYICGTLGALLGADLLNLDKLGGLGASVASIGGAGTFDGIFVTGILAVLLAGIVIRRRTGVKPE